MTSEPVRAQTVQLPTRSFSRVARWIGNHQRLAYGQVGLRSPSRGADLLEWNPKRVASYRLIGYENRLLEDRDFKDDTKDAGEIGSGHSVTALYEVELASGPAHTESAVDPLKYQTGRALTAAAEAPELLTLKLRYKAPSGGRSTEKRVPVLDRDDTSERGSDDFRWAAAVAGFGMLLRGSPHAEGLSLDLVRSLANSSLGSDKDGDRAQFLELLGRASALHLGG